MNKIIVLVCCLFLTSCVSNEDVIPNEAESTTFLNGVEVNSSEITTSDDLIVIFDSTLNQNIYFDQKEMFESYAHNVLNGDLLITANNQLLAVRGYLEDYPETISIYEETGSYPQPFIRFMKENGTPLDKIETRNVTVLFDDNAFGGGSYTAPLIPIPSLGNFRNRASSLQAYVACGVRQLCARRWWGGARYLYVGCPYFETTDLGQLNDDGESIFQ